MYIKHSFIYLLSKLAPALSSFVILAAYTRWMTTQEYGIFSTLVIVAGSSSMFLFSWLYVGIMRFWENQQIDNEAIVYLISMSVLVISVVVGLCAGVFAVATGQTEVAVGGWLLFISAVMFEAGQRINVITRQVNRYLWAEMARTLLTMLSGLLLVWLGYAWQGAVLAIVTGMLLVVIFSMHRYFRFSLKQTDGRVLKMLLIYGLPLSFSLALLEVVNTADRLMIGWLLGYARVGEYAVAYNLPFQVLMMVSSSLNMAAYPVVVRVLEQEGRAAATQQLRHYFTLLMAASVPAVFGLVAIADLLVPLLVGADFVAPALQLMPWVSVAIFANCTYLFYVSLSFQLAEQTMGALKVAGVAALINVVLNLLLIPVYGVWGAVIASVSAYGFCLVAGFYVGRHYFALDIPWFALLKILLAASVMYGVIQHLPVLVWPPVVLLVLKISVGVVVYVVLVWLFNIAGIRQMLAAQISLRMRHV